MPSATHIPVDSAAIKLTIAIAIGMLVGLEREWSNKDMGIRTFSVVSLLGCVCTFAGYGFTLAGAAIVICLFILANIRSILVDQSLEITTSAALAVTYFLGVLVALGHTFTPITSAILMTMLLAWKSELQRFAGGITPDEIRSAILLCLIGLVIYPLLPDRFIDRWSLVEPRQVWITVIIIAALGFLNYVLLRLYSGRGLFWAAGLGGLVNSTAAVAQLGVAARSVTPERYFAVILLTVLAMFARNLAILALLSPAALATAWMPIAAMSIPVVIVLVRTRPTQEDEETRIQLTSPLSLTHVLKFGALFLLIQVVASLAQRWLGNAGFTVVSTLGGLVSSASSVASAANLSLQAKVSLASAGYAAIGASIASALVNLPIVIRQLRDRRLVVRLFIVTGVQLLLAAGCIFAQIRWMAR